MTDQPKITTVGILHHVQEEKPDGQCIIVLGHARSGTSMTAGILRQLGCFMGRRRRIGNHEDLEFTELARPVPTMRLTRHQDRPGKIDALKALIRDRDRNHDFWGWKDPMSFYYAADVVEAAANPKIIALFRDPAAMVRSRYALSGSEMNPEADPSQLDLQAVVRNALASQKLMVEALLSLSCPQFWLSYEKALLRPEEFLDVLSGFLARPIDPETRKRLVEYIDPYNDDATF